MRKPLRKEILLAKVFIIKNGAAMNIIGCIYNRWLSPSIHACISYQGKKIPNATYKSSSEG
jgi:hypothetical protein